MCAWLFKLIIETSSSPLPFEEVTHTEIQDLARPITLEGQTSVDKTLNELTSSNSPCKLQHNNLQPSQFGMSC